MSTHSNKENGIESIILSIFSNESWMYMLKTTADKVNRQNLARIIDRLASSFLSNSDHEDKNK